MRGYKFSYNHIEKYPAILPWLQRNDILIIHLIRRNLVKRYLSHLTKKVRGQAHSTQPVEAVRVHVSPRKLMKNVERQEHLLDKYQRIFAAAPKAYLEVDYEAFVSNRGVETDRVLSFLNVLDRRSLQSNLVKQNPDSIADIVTNYQEVALALTGTSFQKYLEM